MFVGGSLRGELRGLASVLRNPPRRMRTIRTIQLSLFPKGPSIKALGLRVILRCLGFW